MPEREPSLPGRLVGSLADVSLRTGARVARRLGVEDTARVAVDRVLAGPLAERITQQLIAQGVIERVTNELLESGVPRRVIDQVLASDLPEEVLDRVLAEEFAQRVVARVLAAPGIEPAAAEVIESDLTDELTRRLLESEEMTLAIKWVAQSPEVRNVIARQGVGLIEDVGRKLSAGARRLDDAVEIPLRWLARRPRRRAPVGQAGAVSRGLAGVLDALVVNAMLFVLSAAIALVVSAFGGSPGNSEALVAGSIVWLAGAALYLAVFWTLAGQTPGMRFMRVRVAKTDGSGLTAGDSVRRLLGMVLAALPLFLGYALVLVNDRRRGLMDLFAHTEVSYVPDEFLPGPAGSRGGPTQLPAAAPEYDAGSQREPTKG
jgi:uncharacterized RDD family membrane protein YckC